MDDEDIHLGPNGGLVFCLEYLQQNLDWLDAAIGDHDSDYILFDCPGQIELYSHLPIMPRLLEHLQRKWDFRIVTVFLLDARFLLDSSHFIAGVLSALSAMVALATAHINIMSKLDILPEKKQKYVIARYLNPDLNNLLEMDHSNENVRSSQRISQHSRLNRALSELVEQYSSVQFLPFNREKEDSISDVLCHIDQCMQYDEEVDPPNHVFDEAERELIGPDDGDESFRISG